MFRETPSQGEGRRAPAKARIRVRPRSESGPGGRMPPAYLGGAGASRRGGEDSDLSAAGRADHGRGRESARGRAGADSALTRRGTTP